MIKDSSFEIKVARNFEELKQMPDFWLDQNWHPNSDIDFYLNILNSRAENAKPFVISLGSEDHTELMWIGRIELKKIKLKLGYFTFAEPNVKTLTFIYGGILGEQSEEQINQVLEYLSSLLKNGEFDAILFQHINRNSMLYNLVNNYQPIFTRDFFPETFTHWKMTLPGSMDDVYRKISSKRRQEIRRQSRKLERDFNFDIDIKCFRNPDEVDELMEETELIAANSYQRGIGVGFTHEKEMKNRLAFLAECGWLRGFVLYVNKVPCAFNIGTVYHHQFFGNYTSFDRRYDKYTPGTYLLIYVMKTLMEEQVTSLDFGFGDAFYKSRFGDENWDEVVLYLFSPSFKGIIISFLRTITILTSRLAFSILGGFSQRLKKYWRKKLMQETL